MSEIEILERQALEVKDIGHTSKFLVPINKFLEIADKAKRWDAMPQPVKDAAEMLRGPT